MAALAGAIALIGIGAAAVLGTLSTPAGTLPIPLPSEFSQGSGLLESVARALLFSALKIVGLETPGSWGMFTAVSPSAGGGLALASDLCIRAGMFLLLALSAGLLRQKIKELSLGFIRGRYPPPRNLSSEK